MQASKPEENKTQPDLEGFILVPKTKKLAHKKTAKETQVQNPATANPFVALVQEDTQQEPHQTETLHTISLTLPILQETQQEIQTKKQKRDASPLLLEYTNTNTQNSTAMEITEMEESDHSKVENLLEGVNLQAVITTCQA